MLMAVVGYALVKLHALKQEDSRVISVLLIRVLQPCLILRAFQIELTPDRMQGFIFATAASTISMLISIAFVKAMEKPLGFDPVDRASLTYANVGNLILPLISMSLGEEMVFYGSAFQIPFNLLIWTHCYSMLTGGQSLKLKKMVTNPSLIALCVGLLLLITQIRLPSVVDDAARGFHEMVAASSMMLIGMIIAYIIVWILHIDTIIIAYFGAVLFSLYIGYDIWRSQQLPHTVGNAVASACEIYVDIVNLFLRLLEILGHSSKN